jgi:hypothetical protein
MEDAMRTAIPLTVLATALACSLATTPANARARVFVASYGNDENPCTFGSPCRNFQQAVNVVDAGGEVTAIDSAGFGPITISHAITITSPDGVEAGIVATAGGNAITINAGPNDAIVLRGLTLNGSGIAYNGIVFNSGASLTITNCVAQNFVQNAPQNLNTGNGILIQPISGAISFVVTDTIASNNGYAGIYYQPPSGSATAAGVIDHVVATNNSGGILMVTIFGGGSTTAVISNSIVNNNSAIGIDAENASAALAVSIDNSGANGNKFGISASNTAKVTLGRSVITANSTVGIFNNTSPNTFFSYKDNRINENNTDISAALNYSLALQ